MAYLRKEESTREGIRETSGWKDRVNDGDASLISRECQASADELARTKKY